MNVFIKTVAFIMLTLSSAAVLADSQNTPVDDATITRNVQIAIVGEPALVDQKITVSTNQGVVSLSGNVKTDRQASLAIEAAESTAGVQDVDTSNLTVKDSKHPMDDTIITAKVKGIFLREKLFGTTNMPAISIHVDTKNGVVYLTGEADNQDQVSKAIALAQSVNGVKKVDAKVRTKN